MKKLTLILLFSFLMLAVAACQRGPSPEEIILSQVDLIARGDLEGMASIYADDISFTMTGFPPEPLHLSGKEAVQGWVSEQLADNMRIDLSVTSAEGNMVKATTGFITDSFAAMGLEKLYCDEVYVFEKGLLSEWSCTLTEESVDEFMAAVQAIEATASPPKIMVTFDGEQCLVNGPDSVTEGRVLYSFDNKSGSTARMGVAKLDDGLSAEEVLSSIGSGSSELPSGATKYSGTKGVLAGKTLDEYGIDMEPGVYILSCAFVSSDEAYPGQGLTINE